MRLIMFLIGLLVTVTPAMAIMNNYAPEATVTPVVDGNLAEGEWDDAVRVEIVYPGITQEPNQGCLVNNAPSSPEDLSGTWYAKWDDDNLYFAFRVYDGGPDFVGDYPGPYFAGDCVQLCFNLLNDPMAIYEGGAAIYDIVPQSSGGPDLYKHSGTYMSAPNAVVGGTVESDGYILEVAFPWSDFEYTPRPGDVHGMGVWLNDRDGGISFQTILCDDLEGSWANHEDVTKWNTLTLTSAEGCGLWGMYDSDVNGDCVVNMSDLAVIAESWGICTEPDGEGCVNLK